MPTSWDVIIVGLGAMGSATAFHLAKRGQRVLGLDRFSPPHTLGSSHGESRIIREAYFEHPHYVPMVQRAYQLWDELQQAAGQPLLLETGGLMLGSPDGVVVPGARRSAEMHHLPHHILSATEMARRFPALRPGSDMIGVWEPRAGILYPEKCIAAHLDLARHHGASLRLDEPVVRWEASGDGVRVVTEQAEYHARQLLLSAGSWINALLPELKIPLIVERQVLFWFEPGDRTLFDPKRCPIHLWEYAPGKCFYGFPDVGSGVKVAGHHEGEGTSPEAIRRDVGADEVEAMRHLVRTYLPGLSDRLLRSAVCMYTNTPDGHFFMDRHPAHPQVLIASPCSGHGFKFASVIGEILSDLLTEGQTPFDLTLFRNRGFL